MLDIEAVLWSTAMCAVWCVCLPAAAVVVHMAWGHTAGGKLGWSAAQQTISMLWCMVPPTLLR